MLSTKSLVVATLAASLALAAGACGGAEDEPELSAESAAAVEQIEAFCDEWNASLDERGEFPLTEFDAENPSVDELPTVGDYFAAGQPARDEMIASIAAVSVPSEIQAEKDTLVEALERGQANARKQAAAAQAADVDGFTATLDEADASQQAIDEAAEALGASSCTA